MTELEELTQASANVLYIPDYLFDTFTEALKDAYDLGCQSYARELGAKGGSANSPAQVAARKRAKKGAGRPKKQPTP